MRNDGGQERKGACGRKKEEEKMIPSFYFETKIYEIKKKNRSKNIYLSSCSIESIFK